MWEVIKQYNKEGRGFNPIFSQKRHARLNLKCRNFLLISILIEKSPKIRCFGTSGLLSGYQQKVVVNLGVVAEMCPVFFLAGAQTKNVDDSLLLSSNTFFSFFRPYTYFSNGTSLILGFSIAEFFSFFSQFIKARSLTYKHCQLYNNVRKRVYWSSLVATKAHFRRLHNFSGFSGTFFSSRVVFFNQFFRNLLLNFFFILRLFVKQLSETGGF